MLAGLRVTLSEEETSVRLASDTGAVIVYNKLSWGVTRLKRDFHHCDAYLTVATWSGRHDVPRLASPRPPRPVPPSEDKEASARQTRAETKAPAVPRSAFRLRPWLSDIFAPLPLSFLPFDQLPSSLPVPPPLLPVPIRRATHARVIPLVLLQLACSPPHTTAPGRLGTNAP
jgi:hypothetical protein